MVKVGLASGVALPSIASFPIWVAAKNVLFSTEIEIPLARFHLIRLGQVKLHMWLVHRTAFFHSHDESLRRKRVLFLGSIAQQGVTERNIGPVTVATTAAPHRMGHLTQHGHLPPLPSSTVRHSCSDMEVHGRTSRCQTKRLSREKTHKTSPSTLPVHVGSCVPILADTGTSSSAHLPGKSSSKSVREDVLPRC